MTLVALVFGELSSECPLSGALYQYGKYNVGPRYGWFVGLIYGFVLLATVVERAHEWSSHAVQLRMGHPARDGRDRGDRRRLGGHYSTRP